MIEFTYLLNSDLFTDISHACVLLIPLISLIFMIYITNLHITLTLMNY